MCVYVCVCTGVCSKLAQFMICPLSIHCFISFVPSALYLIRYETSTEFSWCSNLQKNLCKTFVGGLFYGKVSLLKTQFHLLWYTKKFNSLLFLTLPCYKKDSLMCSIWQQINYLFWVPSFSSTEDIESLLALAEHRCISNPYELPWEGTSDYCWLWL